MKHLCWCGENVWLSHKDLALKANDEWPPEFPIEATYELYRESAGRFPRLASHRKEGGFIREGDCEYAMFVPSIRLAK